jgi:hypothetical protein
MENDEASGILADQPSIDAQLARRPSRSDVPQSHRRDGSGASDPAAKTKASSEVTPLLSRDENEEDGAGTPPPNYDDPPPYKVWDGYRDFEGLPWYKQPSVCLSAHSWFQLC